MCQGASLPKHPPNCPSHHRRPKPARPLPAKPTHPLAHLPTRTAPPAAPRSPSTRDTQRPPGPQNGTRTLWPTTQTQTSILLQSTFGQVRESRQAGGFPAVMQPAASCKLPCLTTSPPPACSLSTFCLQTFGSARRVAAPCPLSLCCASFNRRQKARRRRWLPAGAGAVQRTSSWGCSQQLTFVPVQTSAPPSACRGSCAGQASDCGRVWV